jgi:large subunit ribosomal protein L7e
MPPKATTKPATKTAAPSVPEGVLKKQARDAKLKAEFLTARDKRRVENKARKLKWTENAKKYAQEYAAADKAIVDAKRKARAEGGFFVPAEPKVALIIRIRGVNHQRPQVVRILRLLRLRQINNATFVRINKASLNMIQRVLPFVTLGYPSRTTVSNLIYKRGFGKVNKQRIPLTSNFIIEQALGKYGITCIEDLIHEITTAGPNFKVANNFLWSFKLSPPKGGFISKRQAFHAGGDWGNREVYINDLVERML